jgi:hypothetical protein
MKIWLQRHPFLTVGLTTFALFLLVESIPGGIHTTPLVGPIVRVLIAPLWVMRTLEVIVGMGTWPGIAQLVVALPLLFAPYMLVDWVLARVRARRALRSVWTFRTP